MGKRLKEKIKRLKRKNKVGLKGKGLKGERVKRGKG